MKKILIALAIGVATIIMAPVAEAQTAIPLTIYPLTNSISGTNNISMTNGATLLNAGVIYTVSSQTFPVWRGRGFGFNLGLYGTNTVSVNLTNTIRFANVHKIPGTSTWVTNWIANANQTVILPCNSTTSQALFANVPPTSVDNVTIGQLYQVQVGSTTNALWLDATNSFVGTYP